MTLQTAKFYFAARKTSFGLQEWILQSMTGGHVKFDKATKQKIQFVGGLSPHAPFGGKSCALNVVSGA